MNMDILSEKIKVALMTLEEAQLLRKQMSETEKEARAREKEEIQKHRAKES